MLAALGLRLRIFLLFAGVGAASCAVVGLAHYIGYSRAPDPGSLASFVFSGVLSAFGLLAISTGVWLLFDENVAKPIERISSAMRTRAHADVTTTLGLEEARYLGDLAPAVHAVTGALDRVAADADDVVAEETARLAAERAHLALLLTEIPVAIILVSPTHHIMLYDGQAADTLGQIHVPRLSASIFDYFVEEDFRPAHSKLSSTRREVEAEVRGTRGQLSFRLRLKRLSQASGYIVLIDAAQARIGPDAARPLIYDFDLSGQETEKTLEHRSLRDLCFVVFDTETTGLMPNRDEIVQIGAVRVVGGRIVPGEAMDQLVHPGCAIPSASTRVHGITDEMVAAAPDAAAAVSDFHLFARDSVLVAHNAPFDMAFLQRHGKMSGLAFDHPILDTVLLSAVVFGTNEVHTLDALCERLGVKILNAVRHTALGDAQATAGALCKLLPILRSRGFDTFGKVIEQTRKHGRLLKDMN